MTNQITAGLQATLSVSQVRAWAEVSFDSFPGNSDYYN